MTPSAYVRLGPSRACFLGFEEVLGGELNFHGLAEDAQEEGCGVGRALAVVKCNQNAIVEPIYIGNAGLDGSSHAGIIDASKSAVCRPPDTVAPF